MAKRGGNFSHIKSVIIEGKRFRSRFEADLYLASKRKGFSIRYESGKLPYVMSHDYNWDYELENGILIEAKGRLLKSDRTKMLAVKKQHPDRDIRFVFQNAHAKCTPTMTNAQWAERHGFKWAHKEIPDEWHKE